MPVTYAVAVLAVPPVVHALRYGKLIVLVIAIVLVSVVSPVIQLRQFIVHLLHVGLVCLLSNRLRVGVPVSARHGGRIPHRVLHGLIAPHGILISVLLIEHIRVHIVFEGLTVQNFLVGRINLPLIGAGIRSGLVSGDALIL